MTCTVPGVCVLGGVVCELLGKTVPGMSCTVNKGDLWGRE